MPTYTFSCCTTFDRRVGFDVSFTSCPECGKEAQRESVYRVNFGGFSVTPRDERDWSHDFANYREANAEYDYKKARLEDGMQKQLSDPPFFRAAQAKAKDLLSKGATVDDLS